MRTAIVGFVISVQRSVHPPLGTARLPLDDFLEMYIGDVCHMWCNVTGQGLVGHRLDTTWAKVLRLCYQTTTESDLLLEAAIAIICTVESS